MRGHADLQTSRTSWTKTSNSYHLLHLQDLYGFQDPLDLRPDCLYPQGFQDLHTTPRTSRNFATSKTSDASSTSRIYRTPRTSILTLQEIMKNPKAGPRDLQDL